MKTICFGTIIRQFDAINSTNEFAEKLLLNEKPCEGSVILAGYQKEGHGTGGNTWYSEAGKNLLASIILYPEFLPPASQFELNKVISLAVLYCVKGFLPNARVTIKWPNDIYVGYRKIAGILIKNSITGTKTENTIVGIGLNVNQNSFPSSLNNPISLSQVSGQTFDVLLVLQQLMEFLEILYQKLKLGEFGFISDQYLQNLLNMNRKSWYHKDNLAFEGIIKGVSQFGRLIMEVDNELVEYDFKEITFLFKNFQSQ